MMHKLIAEIAANDSKLHKESVIRREALKGNDEFFAGIRFALDNADTFGVKNVKNIPVRTGPNGPGLPFWTAFTALANKLIKRELTGGAATTAIEAAMAQATNEQWNGWYRLILIKDLKAGFSESTVNKAVEKINRNYVIPVFECQLAYDCVDKKTGDVLDEYMTGKKHIDVKLDGQRVLSIVHPTGGVIQYSRNGKELLNFGKIAAQIEKNRADFSESMVLDGEVMSASFQDLMKQARRKTDVQTDDAVLNLFDIIPLKEFLNGVGTRTQADRTAALEKWYNDAKHPMANVTVVGHEIVDLDSPKGQARLSEINEAALSGKYEGIMLKDPDAVYECKRSYNWLKMKPYIEETLAVIDVEEGKPDGKFLGTMGALVCAGTVDNKKVKTRVGGGFSIQARAQIWADFTGKPVTWQKKDPITKKWITITERPTGRKVVGMLAEIRADALTKSDIKDEWSMRFPRFKTWRGVEVGEKV